MHYFKVDGVFFHVLILGFARVEFKVQGKEVWAQGKQDFSVASIEIFWQLGWMWVSIILDDLGFDFHIISNFSLMIGQFLFRLYPLLIAILSRR